jgi:hypothetical protein
MLRAPYPRATLFVLGLGFLIHLGNGGRRPADDAREPRFTRQARNEPRTPSAGPATAPESSSRRISSSP